MYHYVLLLLLLGMLSLPTDAQDLPTTALDSIFTHHETENGFSGVVLVAKDGTVGYQRATGYRYRDTENPIELATPFSIASVTKTFTAVLVFQLVERGELALEDHVTDVLPNLPLPTANPITVADLLRHQSGLPATSKKQYHYGKSLQEMVDETLAYRPKAEYGKFNYNELDYLLLGLLIERKIGLAWREAVRRYILDPVGMENTGFLAYGKYPRGFAFPYSARRNGKLVQDPLFAIENFHSGGSMYATAADLLRLDRALYDDTLLGQEGRALLGREFFDGNHAGYSVWNYRYPFAAGKPLVMERRGGILGANVVLVRLPEDGYTIIVLSNNDRFNPDSWGDPNNLREGLIRTLFTPPSPGR